MKSLLIAAFSSFAIFFAIPAFAQEKHESKQESAVTESKEEKSESDFNPGDVIMEHILDNHDFHFAEINGHSISIPLPVIVYSPQRG
ncbi:hypothetical protein ABTM49_19465, partial [Acinetobacter baumannii]